MFKSKGAVLVLVWSFFGFSAFQSLYTTHFYKSSINWQIGTVTIFRPDVVALGFIFCPIVGWLADTKFGRYKVIKWSFITLIVLSTIFSIASIFQGNSGSHLVNRFLLLWHVPMALAFGGIVANTGQLGLDQLYDASSSEIASFVLWWTWTWTLSGIVAGLGQSCFCKLPALTSLFLPVAITCGVCTDLLFSSWLIKESPPTCSPFSNIYKVLSYALKHKYPTRSAPTDWDERRSARLDVGKRIYGGPFTNEEVEDVKTLLRICAVLIVGMIFISPHFSVDEVFSKIMSSLDDQMDYYTSECNEVSWCFSRLGVVYSGDFAIIFVIPLFEIILSSALKLFYSISILKRCFIGMIIATLSITAAVFVVLAAQHNSHTSHNGTCFEEIVVEHTLDYRWMAIPYSLRSAVPPLLLSSGANFILAQSPYSLKGFLFGLTYGLIGLSGVMGFGIHIGLQSIAERWLLHPYGCTFWYLILVLSTFFILLIASYISFKCYKRRQREDKNEHLFAIDYFS